jgi:hypothetical protein
MTAGVATITLSSVSSSEQTRWRQAAHREGQRYNIEAEYVEARMDGRQCVGESTPSRTTIDWLLVAAATAMFAYFGANARLPQIPINWLPAIILSAATLALVIICGTTLYRTTRFH